MRTTNSTSTARLDGVFGVPLHLRDTVQAFRIWGTEHELVMPTKRTFTIGAEADLVIPSVDGRRHVSRVHARVTRIPGPPGCGDVAIDVEDLDSHNGTWSRGMREKLMRLHAGDPFMVATTSLYVLDRTLMDLRAALGRNLGLSEHRVLDRTVSELLAQRPVALHGHKSLERRRLARVIHDQSQRRGRPFVVIEKPNALKEDLARVLATARGGSVFVSLDDLKAGAADNLLTLLFDEPAAVRPIVAAKDGALAQRVLHQWTAGFVPLAIPPVAARRDDVPAILDAMIGELGSGHRVAELGPTRIAAMQAYAWPSNHVELRTAAENIDALLRQGGNVTAAAAFLNKNYDGYRDALIKVGAYVPDERRGGRRK